MVKEIFYTMERKEIFDIRQGKEIFYHMVIQQLLFYRLKRVIIICVMELYLLCWVKRV